MSAPLSWRDARVLLDALQGPEAPAAWKGGLPITYRVGAGPAAVRMRVQMDDKVRPIWTVTGRITGAASPDQLVIVGNHRDAWVYGGVDPSSGTASLMELARSLGTLAKQGARPDRTIVFANWDAEEFTLTSSTEWGEQHARDLGEHAVAYLNVDSSASGQDFKASAVPSLNRLVVEAARDMLDLKDDDRAIVSNRLGSGSDYTVFLNFLGVPIVDMSFSGPYGVYHSVYDNHLWMQKFGDPGFVRHAAMTRLWGVMALRLANADIVPLDYRATADRIREFVKEKVEAARPGDRAALRPLDAAADRFAAAADGGRPPDGDAARRRDRRSTGDGRAQPDADEDRARVPPRRRHPGPALVPSSDLRAEADLRAGGAPGRDGSPRGWRSQGDSAQVANLVAALDRAAATLAQDR